MLLLLLAIMIFTGVTSAQEARTETGTLRGVVATEAPDGQSYNIPGASLKLKRGMQFAETSANDAGEYEFTKLLPGEYTLEATADGFKTSSKTITIPAGETLLENISLEVAEVTASVTVASDAAQPCRRQKPLRQYRQTEDAANSAAAKRAVAGRAAAGAWSCAWAGRSD